MHGSPFAREAVQRDPPARREREEHAVETTRRGRVCADGDGARGGEQRAIGPEDVFVERRVKREEPRRVVGAVTRGEASSDAGSALAPSSDDVSAAEEAVDGVVSSGVTVSVGVGAMDGVATSATTASSVARASKTGRDVGSA